MLIALLGALAIGTSLGLIGSGGSILTLPVLIFMLERPDKLAIAESLAIVGLIACIGSGPYVIRGQVDWKSVAYFGLTGIMGAYLGALASQLISGSLQLSLFALVMLIASGMMLFGPQQPNSVSRYLAPWQIMIEGFLVGILTGLLGIGGGFLIVPGLIFFCGLSMRLAIGTSLVIITMNSWIGFMAQWQELSQLELHVDWGMIFTVAIIGMLGSLAGTFLGAQMHQTQLRKLFAINIFLVGISILTRELSFV